MSAETASHFSSDISKLSHALVSPIDSSPIQAEVFISDRVMRAQGIADLLTFVGEGNHNYGQQGYPPIVKEVLPGVHIYDIKSDDDGSVRMRVLQHHLGEDSRFGVRNGSGWRGEETKAVLEANLQKSEDADTGWSIEFKFLRHEKLRMELQRYERLRNSPAAEDRRMRNQEQYELLLKEVSLLGTETPSPLAA